MTLVRTIRAAVHGRYLLDVPDTMKPTVLVVGFHGYAESADTHHQRLLLMPGHERWATVSVQGLSRFYRRSTRDVIASWMTREDRELAIADNLAYVDSVVAAAADESGLTAAPLVFAGFSQGVAMAYRAACAAPRRVSAVVSLGGDVPPELDSAALARIDAALVARGASDEWYTEAKMQSDLARLQQAQVAVQPFTFDAGHEWTTEFAREAGAFIRRFE